MFSIVIVAILFTVIYYIRKFSKIPKELENLPYVSPIPFALAWLKQKPYDELQEVIAENTVDKDLYLSRYGPFNQVSLVSPEALKVFLMESEDIARKFDEYPPESTLHQFFGIGLPFANGERWRVNREIANPIFNDGMSSPVESAETVFELFSIMDLNLDQPIGVFELLQRFTVEVLGRMVFGYEFGCFKTVENPRLLEVYKHIMDVIESPYQQIFPWISKLPLPSNKRFFNHLDEFNEYMYEIIRTKQNEIASNKRRDDLLTIMIEHNEKNKLTDLKGIRDDLVNYFVAGHETTAMTLSNTLYYLAKHPEIQEKAREEAIKILGNEPTAPTVEQLKEFKYIHAILKESLRINPPTPVVTFRKLAKPIKIGQYVIPENTLCSANAWQIHRNPRIWDKPNEFIPERFLAGGEKGQQFSWLPFSAGPRNCVGQNLSLLEQKIIIPLMLLKYKWTLPEDSIHKEKLVLTSQILLRPVDLKLNFTARV